ncbi:MAG: High-affinity nickel transporter, partial [Planctomycetota bacterium]
MWMLVLLSVLASGLLAGTVHVVSGPDHLVAIAPLSASDGRAGWRAGLWWGAG